VNRHQDVGGALDLAAGLLSECLPWSTIENGLHEMLESTRIVPCELHREMPALRLYDSLRGTRGINVINAIDQTPEVILYHLPWSRGEWRPIRLYPTSTTLTDATYLQCMCARAQSATNMVHQCTHQLYPLRLLKALR
jgi:hypothetical protein